MRSTSAKHCQSWRDCAQSVLAPLLLKISYKNELPLSGGNGASDANNSFTAADLAPIDNSEKDGNA